MLTLRHRKSLRIPDPLAITAVLLLAVSAAGGVLADRYLYAETATQDASAIPAESSAADPNSDETLGEPAVRLLLFRHG